MKLLALVVFGTLAATVCENDVANQPPAPSVVEVDPREPCALLSPAQVQRAVGTKVRSENEVGSHDLVTRICHYETTEPWASVGVSIKDGISQGQFEKLMDRDRLNTESVDGIGDGAFIYGCSGITVLVDDVVLSLGVQHLTACEETGDVLRALGREATIALKPSP